MLAIERLGFFHFVQNYGEPIEQLEVALKEPQPSELEGSLIVLPETFNLGRFYREPVREGQFRPTAPFLERLSGLAQQYGAVFVVGVLEATAESGLPPYNSAFLVSPDETRQSVLMSRKEEKDPRGPLKLYRSSNGSCGQNPIEYAGVCIAAFVCNDYYRFDGEARKAIDASSSLRKVLCIPACMNSGTFSGQTVGSVRGCYAILANSDPDGCGSFIKNRDGNKKASFGESPSHRVNKTMLRTWIELESES